jgi:hypothetical protein
MKSDMDVSHSQRPRSITTVCIIGFIGAALFILGMTNSHTREQMLRQDQILAGLVTINMIGAIIGLIGMFLMRKWGWFTYLIVQSVCAVAAVSHSGIPTAPKFIFHFAIPAITVYVGAKHLSEMK